MKKYDLLVLGGGAGGLVVAAGAANFGAKVALIDPAPLGGDCLWSGCVPTKSLLHVARIVHQAREANAFEIHITGQPRFSLVKKYYQQAIQTIQQHDDPKRFQALGVDLYLHHGSFAGKHEIWLDNEKLIQGKRIVIATGSKPRLPAIPGLAQADVLTNESILQLEKLPASLTIIGGGAIGIEYAQVFCRLGSKVTVIESAANVLMTEDSDITAVIKQSLQKEGVQFFTGATVTAVRKSANQKEVSIRSITGKQQQLKSEKILVATGRIPQIQTLELETAGVKTEQGAIWVNEHLQTSVKHIYALGDVIGNYPFTHAAAHEGQIVVANAVFGLRQKVDYQNLPWVIYSDPQIYHLGLTEREARDHHKKIQVYQTELKNVDRFITEGNSDGLIKIITDKNGKILGAHAVGPDAGDWMQEVTFAKKFNHQISDLSQVIHPYPTRAGAVQQVADQYWRNRFFTSKLTKWLTRYIRWFR